MILAILVRPASAMREERNFLFGARRKKPPLAVTGFVAQGFLDGARGRAAGQAHDLLQRGGHVPHLDLLFDEAEAKAKKPASVLWKALARRLFNAAEGGGGGCCAARGGGSDGGVCGEGGSGAGGALSQRGSAGEELPIKSKKDKVNSGMGKKRERGNK